MLIKENKDKHDVYDLIQYEDLTPDLQLLTNVCGLEAVRQMLRHFSGLSFYIPRISRLDSFVTHYLKSNKDKNIKEIAKFLNVSEQFLNKLKSKI